MKKCKFEKYLVDYLNNELPAAAHLETEQHLRDCQICSNQIHEIETIHFMLLERKRPEPSGDLVDQFDQELNEIFESKSRFENTRRLFGNFWNFLNNIPPSGIRLAGAVAILIIGIFIGKMVFKPTQKSEIVIIEPTMVNLIKNQSELKLINSYFSDSEVLLLEIMNSNLAEQLADKNFFLSKEIAQKLLIRTFLIHEIALKLDNKPILNFLSNLEFLLYDIANSNDDEIVQKINEIQEMIKDTNLLEKARLFQELFDSKTIQHI